MMIYEFYWRREVGHVLYITLLFVSIGLSAHFMEQLLLGRSIKDRVSRARDR
jgi:hypothetical protein